MSELKILAYIGKHKHIVGLIGAYTANIKNRELYVGVELCETSLLKYLEENRSNFRRFIRQKELHHTNETSISYCNQSIIDSVKIITTNDLIQWSIQIASGMEFLSGKKVIHGDLATRNILLSNTLQAKICDFGLARQLIDYNYIKSTCCPLPWKWMAIESFSQMTFSIKSDVWSYGVTCWEIFSLGQLPYPGLKWNPDFIEQLNSGYRLKKPNYANDAIFKMLSECWRGNPNERPMFVQLKEFFQGLCSVKYKEERRKETSCDLEDEGVIDSSRYLQL